MNTSYSYTCFEKTMLALADLAQWMRVMGWIHNYYLDYQSQSDLGMCRRQLINLSLSHLCFSKINKKEKKKERPCWISTQNCEIEDMYLYVPADICLLTKIFIHSTIM